MCVVRIWNRTDGWIWNGVRVAVWWVYYTHIHIHSCAYVHHEIRALLSKYACEIQIRKNIQLLHYFELNFSNISALIHSLHCVGRLALMVWLHIVYLNRKLKYRLFNQVWSAPTQRAAYSQGYKCVAAEECLRDIQKERGNWLPANALFYIYFFLTEYGAVLKRGRWKGDYFFDLSDGM